MNSPLSSLNVLILDCQATGANPQRGHLLEIGWAQTSASMSESDEPLQVNARLIRLPENEDIPHAVRRVTGLEHNDLQSAVSRAKVHQELAHAATAVASANGASLCPAVIHFARYEAPFLRDLWAQHNSGQAFPFQIICTHEIARRLFPGLPRKGLRAVAGYLGHALLELRRSRDHVTATAHVWKNMIALLESGFGVTSLNRLLEWMAQPPPSATSARSYPMDREVRLNLPDRPGIYRMQRSDGSLLYIGKAGSLKRRVNSYFTRKGPHGEHTLEMLSQASQLEVTQTATAFEAALLETDEIKRCSPPYNKALRRKQRKLVFCSRDLVRAIPQADADHPIGPLPSVKLADSLAAFSRWIEKEKTGAAHTANEDRRVILGLPEAYFPEADCLQAGLKLFAGRHQNRIQRHSPLRLVTALAAELWRARLVQKDLDKETPHEEDESDATIPERVWTPETVASSIEGLVRHAGLMIRRSRWLCLISESALIWETTSRASDKARRRLVFSQGAIVQRQTLGGDQNPLQLPPRVTFGRGRRQCFDLTVYDRLRVATTEIRRLVTENRRVELRIGEQQRVGNERLKQVLRWV